VLSVFSENIGSIVILAVILVIVGLAALKLIRDKKRGKCSCGSSCASCPMSDKCHKPSEKQ